MALRYSIRRTAVQIGSLRVSDNAIDNVRIRLVGAEFKAYKYPLKVEAAANGYYVCGSGVKVDWSRYVQAACLAKVSIPPEASLSSTESITFSETRVQVTNETTLGVVFAIADWSPERRFLGPFREVFAPDEE